MNTPDITLAQIISAIVALAGALVVLFQLDLSDAQRAALTTIITTVVTLGWFVGDAIIRHGRAAALAKSVPAIVATTTSNSPTIPAPVLEPAPIKTPRSRRRPKAES